MVSIRGNLQRTVSSKQRRQLLFLCLSWSLPVVIYIATAGMLFIFMFYSSRVSHGSRTATTAAYMYTDRFQLDKQAAENYLRSFENDKPIGRAPLSFFHIPKTAGTAIEHAAGVRNVAWGSCLFPHRPKRGICRYPDGYFDWPMRVGWWHLPAWLFPLAGANPYQGSDLYAVVRNPYDRMVSEYYYICGLRKVDWRPQQCDLSQINNATYMNEWIHAKVSRTTHDAQYYLQDNGHFVPMHDFLFGPHETRMIDHVLVLEDMQFDKLMKKYGLNYKLENRNAIGAAERGHLTIDDLDDTTIQAINEAYPKDFGLYKYQRTTVHTKAESVAKVMSNS